MYNLIRINFRMYIQLMNKQVKMEHLCIYIQEVGYEVDSVHYRKVQNKLYEFH